MEDRRYPTSRLRAFSRVIPLLLAVASGAAGAGSESQAAAQPGSSPIDRAQPAASRRREVSPYRLAKNPYAVLRWAVAFENGEVNPADPTNTRAYEQISDCEGLGAEGAEKMMTGLTATCTRKFANSSARKGCLDDARSWTDYNAAEFERICFAAKLEDN